MFHFAVDALNQETKFQKYMGKKCRPPEIETIRETLLETTMLDKDLEENRDNNHNFLISLLDAYERHFPAHGSEPTASHRTQVECRPEIYTDTSVGNGAISDDGGNDLEVHEVEDSMKKERKKENEIFNKMLLALKDCDTNCYNMSWQSYHKNSHTSDDGKVGTIIMNPVNVPSRSYILGQRRSLSVRGDQIFRMEVEDLSASPKMEVKQGDYVIVLFNFFMFEEWFNAFVKEKLKVMMYPHHINSELYQKSQQNTFLGTWWSTHLLLKNLRLIQKTSPLSLTLRSQVLIVQVDVGML